MWRRSLRGIACETTAYDVLQWIGERRDVWLLVDDSVQQGRGIPVRERTTSAGGEHQHGPEREHVARRADRRTGDLLRRQVARRTDHHAGRGQARFLECAGDAEVDHPRTVVGQDDVRRLEIAVDEAAGVDRHQRLGQPARERLHPTGRQRAGRVDRLLQRRSGQVLRGQPGMLRVRIGVDDRGRERTTDLPRRLDLAGEPGPEGRVTGQFVANHLHRDQPTTGRAREVDGTHRTTTEPALDRERPDHRRILYVRHRATR